MEKTAKEQLVELAKGIEGATDFEQFLMMMAFDQRAEQAKEEGELTQEEITAIAREHAPSVAK